MLHQACRKSSAFCAKRALSSMLSPISVFLVLCIIWFKCWNSWPLRTLKRSLYGSVACYVQVRQVVTSTSRLELISLFVWSNDTWLNTDLFCVLIRNADAYFSKS